MKKCIFLLLGFFIFSVTSPALASNIYALWDTWDPSREPDEYYQYNPFYPWPDDPIPPPPYDYGDPIPPPTFEGIEYTDYVKLPTYNGRSDVIEYLNDYGIYFHIYTAGPDLIGYYFNLNYTYFENESAPKAITLWNNEFIWDSRYPVDPRDQAILSQSYEANGWVTDHWIIDIYLEEPIAYENCVNIGIILENSNGFHLDRLEINRGDVGILPTPSAIWLLSLGMIGLGWLKKYKIFI